MMPMSSLDCHIYFDSQRHAPPAGGCGEATDVAAGAGAGERLQRLGISPEADLPAVLLSEPDGKLRIVGLRLTSQEVERLAAGHGLPTSKLTVYSSSWCPDCRRAKRVLDEAEAAYEEVDIDHDARAEAAVLERSGGRRVVPTLRFDDRLWAFNPDPPLLRRLLRPEAAV
jgi:mycoredoxin